MSKIHPNGGRSPAAGTLLSALLLTSLFLGCGTEIGNPKKPKGESDSPQVTSLVSDRSVSTDLISAQADEVIAAAAEEAHTPSSVDQSVALDLTEAPAATPPSIVPTTTKVCTEQATGETDFATGFEGTVTQAFTVHDHPATYTAQEAGSEQAVWKLPSGQLKCNATNDALVIDWSQVDGMTTDATFMSTRTTTIVRTTSLGQKTRSGTFQVTGERHSTWHRNAPADTDLVLALTKTVTGQVAKTFSTVHRGTPINVASRIDVKADAPLQIAIERDKTTQAWQSKTILSGVVVSTQDENSRVESTYTNLKFTTASGCVPDSGAVAGKIFNPDGNLSGTFQVTFTAGDATIAYDDGTQAPYIPQFCALDGKP